MSKSINILYWNIHGISSRVTGDKNNDKQFLDIISDYDVVCLSELHTDKTVYSWLFPEETEVSNKSTQRPQDK